MSFLLFFAWGICITLAFFGYGRQVMRLFGYRKGSSWFIAPAVGLSVVVFIGALLNLARWIQMPIAIAHITVGVLLFIISIIQDRKKLPAFLLSIKQFKPHGLVFSVLFIIVLGVLMIRACAFIRTSSSMFNRHDDAQAYLAFPLKMLQTGSFAADPFSERRIQSTLGGITYLQAVSIAPFSDLRITNLVDGSIGLFLFALFCLALCLGLKITANQSIIVFTVLVFTPDFRINTTSVVLPAALLISLALIYADRQEDEHFSLQKLFLFGLVAGTACTLKSSIIPSIGLFTTALFSLELSTFSLGKTLRDVAIVAGSLIITLSPWMIDSKVKCGTALYPLLGHGYHISSYIRPVVIASRSVPPWLLATILLSLPFVLFTYLFLNISYKRRDPWNQIALAALVTAAILPFVVGYLVRQDVIRYSITTIWPVNVFVLAIILAAASNQAQTTSFLRAFSYAYAAFAIVFALFVNPVGSIPGGSLIGYARILKVDLLDRSHPLPEQTLVLEDRAIQQSIPIGATLFARTDQSYGFDFRRNQIFLADYPGSASLPPGMPLARDPKLLSNYLLAHSIRYIAYSYADESNFPRSLCDERTSSASNKVNPWEAREAAAACIIQDDLGALGKIHRRLYDDGKIYVLDLAIAASQ